MDLGNHFCNLLGRTGISSRIQSLSAQTPGALSATNLRLSWIRFKRIILGACLLLAALLAGNKANQLSQQNALLTWELKHAPSAKIWRETLSSHGYKQIQKPELVQRIVRSLPLTISPDEQNSIWITQDKTVVALMAPLADPRKMMLYSRTTDFKAKPLGWTPLGKGWRGFEKTIRALEEVDKSTPNPSLTIRHRPKALDPLAIQY
jgi:hypothetical protein